MPGFQCIVASLVLWKKLLCLLGGLLGVCGCPDQEQKCISPSCQHLWLSAPALPAFGCEVCVLVGASHGKRTPCLASPGSRGAGITVPLLHLTSTSSKKDSRQLEPSLQGAGATHAQFACKGCGLHMGFADALCPPEHQELREKDLHPAKTSRNIPFSLFPPGLQEIYLFAGSRGDQGN